MDINYFVILPTQLFEHRHIPKYAKHATIILWECPWYFNNKKYNFSKKKLLLHKASMEYYYDYLLSQKYTVKKILFNEDFNIKNYAMFDPIDSLKMLGLKPKIVEKSPNFLLTKEHYSKYREKTDKFFFNPFYKFGKSIINVIPDIKSQDKDNRKTMSKKELTKLKISMPRLPKTDALYIQSAIRYVNKNFKGNLGSTDNFMFPVTHQTVKKWLTHFINHKFSKFGDYQDFINTDNGFMFHSLLSTSINIGLINPHDIIKIVMKYKSIIPINSFEGYIRQLFWREYQRYTYIYFYSTAKNLNHFGNTKRLTRKWYTGEICSPPVDDAIKSGINTGYLHHIYRLMVIGNYMNLSGISPQQGFKWFMEFSCDSYVWVMCQNVYGMAFYADGGVTMRRPYISSSNYILKMSNYKRGPWSNKWDNLYREFVAKKR